MQNHHAKEESDLSIQQHPQRSHERRNTDFSQADNDLKRFLSEREQKRRDSDQDPLSSPTYNIADTLRRDVFPSTKLFGSVEKLDEVGTLDNGLQRPARCGSLDTKESCKVKEALKKSNLNRRFRVESCDNSSVERQDSSDNPTTPVLENPDRETLWYSKYFLGKYHYNFIGMCTDKSVFALSVLEERSFGKDQCRCILWTKDGPKRILIQGSFTSRGSNLTTKSILAQFEFASKVEQHPKEISNPALQRDLFSLEKQERAMNLKFGVIFAKSGQITDKEFFSNQEGSPEFERFLDLLGTRIRLKGWHRYRGGLDNRNDMTGTHSVFTVYEDHEIMFHVSTLLPYSENDIQQVERKRHIGNDIVNIVFWDGSVEEMSKFQPQFFRTNFTHIYAVVCYQEENESYHVSIITDNSVPIFGPFLTHLSKFTNHEDFRKFLLVKLINGEKAAYRADAFSSKRVKTFEMLLQDMFNVYANADPDAARTNTGVSIKLRQRRQDNQKDLFVKMGQTLRLDAMLSQAPRVSPDSKTNKSLWEPTCVFPNFPHQVLCGDSWGSFALLIGTSEGTFLVSLNTKSLVMVFDNSIGRVVQLKVTETYDLMIIRAERQRSEGSKIFVFRLSDLEEFLGDLLEWHSHINTLLSSPREPETSSSWDSVKQNSQLSSSMTTTDSMELLHWRPSWEPRNKADLRTNLIELSKGCDLFSVSRVGQGPFRLVFAIGKRIVVMKWRHAEAWISLTTDTADGFDLEAELHAHDLPTTLTLISGLQGTLKSNSPGDSFTPISDQSQQDEDKDIGGCVGVLSAAFSSSSTASSLACTSACSTFTSHSSKPPLMVVVGSKTRFTLYRDKHGARKCFEAVTLFNIPAGGSTGAISATEIVYNEEVEILLSYNNSSHVQKLGFNAPLTHKIEWNSLPIHVFCAFPYILAVTQDGVEFRYAVNGSLLQTIYLPELSIISSKDDLYLCSTRQPFTVRKPLDEGFYERGYKHFYKIPWTVLVNGGSGGKHAHAHCRIRHRTAAATTTNLEPIDSSPREAHF